MDFIRVHYKENKDGTREFYPSLRVLRSEDLVIRGGQFTAVWDEDSKFFVRDPGLAAEIIDRTFEKMVGELRPGDTIRKMTNFDNQMFSRFLAFGRQIGDGGPDLDQTIIFADQEPTKADAATFKMPYSLSNTGCPAWEELTGVLYEEDERTKIEWAIGSILTGASVSEIQKFYVFFGPPASGKSTIMDIISWIFDGHTQTFSAFNLGRTESQFSLEPFAKNPLVAIDQDGDLSRIEMNTNLNSISSHDKLLINAKSKTQYEIIPRATMFIGSNSPVKITDRKSGLYRRLVDIKPTGIQIPEMHYHHLMSLVRFELGSIASKCIDVFNQLGRTYFTSYRSTEMMYRTNDIFNFVEDYRLILAKGITLKNAHKLFVAWCEETDTRNVYKQFQFRDLLKDYYKEFHEHLMINGERHRSWFQDLRELDKFSPQGLAPKPKFDWLELDLHVSLLDELFYDRPAQEASTSGTPKKAWSEVTTTLADLNTSVEHYVKVPTQHIVIDFDLKDENGRKDLRRNLDAAASWPPTYAEASRGGGGLHLHYDWDGDVERLANRAADGSYEVKTLLGNASLRRRLSLCNTTPIATISSGLPLKEEKVLAPKTMQTEKGLRELILKGLRKDVHAGTKSNMDFIKMVTDEAYNSGMKYDVNDMWDDILEFAMNSSNQKGTSMELALSLKLKSDDEVEPGPDTEAPLAYFDLEVYPNLLAIGWMYDRDDAEVVKMINPTAEQVEELFKLRLIGFNNRGYDNHILWAASLGWDNEAIFRLSQRIIVENDRRGMFGAAYSLAYGDLYDIIVDKKSLKRWEIELGLPHMEMDLPWDEPVPADRMQDVEDYLVNDVRSTRAVGKHREADMRARQILAELTGLSVCNTNRQHTEKLVFGNDTPELVYTDLTEMFPGYVFDQFKPGKEKSSYKGESVGEGGWVKSRPGVYENVGVLDIASMHPTSIVALNMFGRHTNNFKDLLDTRLAIKRGDYDYARQLYDGRLAPFLGDEATAKGLSDALKIVINSVYGLTAASFPNKFRDERNNDNIVAKRGALFMVDLVEFVETVLNKPVLHVKTDSIKVADLSDQDIHEIMMFGEKYGYTFEHEDTYEKFCLVNDAVYVAYSRKHQQWEATGAQFAHPVVFKTLFTGEDLRYEDYVEIKQVTKGSMFLVSETSAVKQFVGRFGAFVPVHGGRILLRIDGEKEHAVGGTKGYLWEIDELAHELPINMDYYQKLIDAARGQIEKHGEYAAFTRV